MINVKYRFVFSQFEVDPEITPTARSGASPFTVASKQLLADEMADYRARGSKNKAMDNQGIEWYTGTLTDLGKALKPMTTDDREQFATMIEQFGSDAYVIDQYVEGVARLRNSVDSRLSYQGAELMTTGKITGNNGEGTAEFYSQKAEIPAENFVNAGKTAWSDPSADLIQLMRTIEDKYRDRTGDDQPFKWQIPLKMWRDVFLTNTKLNANVQNYRATRELPITKEGLIIEDWVIDYITVLGVLSPIEIIQEGSIESLNDVRREVKGWANDIAVFRPRGYAGLIKRAAIYDAEKARKYASKTVERSVAYLENGLYGLVNKTSFNTDGYPEWHTDIYATLAPALTEFPYHVIVKTSQADA